MASPVIIHLGFPKTATTTLQTHVLPRLPSVYFYGKHEGKPPADTRLTGFHDFVAGQAGAVRPQRPMPAQTARALLRKGAATGLVPVISKEELLIACLGPRPESWHRRKLIPALTLRDILPPLIEFCAEAGLGKPRFVVTLREQADLLTSFYAQMALTHYAEISEVGSFERFVDVFLNNPELSGSGLLHYPAFEAELADIAGAGNYRLIAHEWLQQDIDHYTAAWAEALGVPNTEFRQAFDAQRPENVRRSAGANGQPVLSFEMPTVSHFLARLKMRWLPDRSLGIGRHLRRMVGHYRLPARSYQPDARLIAAIRDRYQASNAVFLRARPEFRALVDRATKGAL